MSSITSKGFAELLGITKDTFGSIRRGGALPEHKKGRGNNQRGKYFTWTREVAEKFAETFDKEDYKYLYSVDRQEAVNKKQDTKQVIFNNWLKSHKLTIGI